MRALRKTDQGGSVRVSGVVFISIIIAAIIGGSIYYLIKRGELSNSQFTESTQINTAVTSPSQEPVIAKNNGSSSEGAVKGASTAENLPKTGPESSIIELIGVFLLTVSVFGYFSSKRYVPRYL